MIQEFDPHYNINMIATYILSSHLHTINKTRFQVSNVIPVNVGINKRRPHTYYFPVQLVSFFKPTQKLIISSFFPCPATLRCMTATNHILSQPASEHFTALSITCTESYERVALQVMITITQSKFKTLSLIHGRIVATQ